MASLVKKQTKTGRTEFHSLKKSEKREIKKSAVKKQQNNSFSKRKETLLKKAHEIYLASDAEVLVMVKGPSSSTYEYKSPNFKDSVSETTQPLTINTSLNEESEDGSASQPVASFPSPQFITKLSKETQTTETSFTNVTDITLCRICGEGKKTEKALWVGCSRGKCDYWVHAMCIGISVKTQAPLSRMKYLCPSHRM